MIPPSFKISKEVSKKPRSKLLEDTEKIKRDPQLIFVCDWHPNVSHLPSALMKHLHLFQNDTTAKEISVPMVAYRRPISFKNILLKNREREVKTPRKTEACESKKCQLCKGIIVSTEKISNTKRGTTIKPEGGGTCQTKNAKEKPKMFWNYGKSRLKTRDNISSLKREDGSVAS